MCSPPERAARDAGARAGLPPDGRPLSKGAAARDRRRRSTALPDLPEWLSPDLLAARGWPAFRDGAQARCTSPEQVERSGPTGPAWQRLAFDELLASQLALVLVRGSLRRGRGTAWQPAGRLRERIEGALPFSLTASQRQALAEIERDLAGDKRMLRLLQGDVGSGKTIVALIAMADVVEAGGQAALMAPTELLARQHFSTIAPLAEAAGIEAVLLTGGDRAAERSATLERIATGRARDRRRHARALPGRRRVPAASASSSSTSSIASACISGWRSPRKGAAPDMLVMTATPIPRTLVLSYFGDMDVSRLTEKPAGRQPIDTRAVPLDPLDEVVARIGERDRGRRQGLLGLPAGRGIGEDRPRGRRRALRQAQHSPSARASGSSTAA